MAGRIGEIHRILSFTIKLRDGNDRKSLQAELEEIIQQVPSKRAEVISTADGLLVSGEDELELLSLRSKALFDSHAEVGNLKINFRETIRKSGAAEGKYIRQTGGMGNYGHCKLRVEPNLPGNGNEFVEDIRVGAVPSKYIEPIHQGVQDALERGIIAGYPIIDVKVTLYDGSYHEADSNEMSFRIAASQAFKEAARKAKPVLMPPASSGVDSVATVGTVAVHPGAINSVPSRVTLTLDIRDTDVDRRTQIMSALHADIRDIQSRRHVTIAEHQINADVPAISDPHILSTLESICNSESIPYKKMVARAYHDTSFIAPIAPVAMIFIPCRNGVSHRPDEYSAPESIALGTRVLALTLAQLTKEVYTS